MLITDATDDRYDEGEPAPPGRRELAAALAWRYFPPARVAPTLRVRRSPWSGGWDADTVGVTVKKTNSGMAALAGGAGLLIAWIASVPAASAVPAACGGGVRYASTSNTTYLTEAKTYTLTDVAANCTSAPLRQVDAATKTWLLSSDLVLQNGATLALKGSAAGGDVNTLRIRSRATNALAEVQAITAQYGTIEADAVTVTSWDDVAGGPDTKADFVSGATLRGRAFVRALSYVDAGGAARQSRMTINNSTFTNLGYYAAESYGVSYKSRQCGRANPAACATAPVTGWQKNSTFSKNYMGLYLWGASNMEFTGNRYLDNVSYGWDGHDVATNLVVTGNRFEGNGNHGWICSQLCDNLTVTGNVAARNGMVPWSGPDPDKEAAGQVHGMMLHRGITKTVLADNTVTDHPNGAGIAVFDTRGAVIRNNMVQRAKYGIRLSVGARENRFENNTVAGSTSYAVYTYAGSDAPAYTPTVRPTANRFVGNTIDGSGSSVIKLGDSDAFTFDNNVLRNLTTPIELTRAANHVLTGNTLPSGQLFRLRGTSSSPTSVTITPGAGVRIDRDAYSTATLR